MPKKIVFFHIPKTAGTTVQQLFMRNEQNTRGLYEYWEDQTQQLLTEFDQTDEAIWLGHFKFWRELQNKGNTVYVTMLREPAEQVVSLWLHIQRSNRQKHESLKKVYANFEEFLNTHLSRNMQCQMLSDLRVQREDKQSFVDEALENLKEFIDIPLVSSEFEEACTILGKNFKWKHWYVPVQNKAHVNQEQEKMELLAKYRDRILQQNQGDLALYEYAKQRQQELYASLGNERCLKLEYFIRKQRSRLYGKMLSIMRQD